MLRDKNLHFVTQPGTTATSFGFKPAKRSIDLKQIVILLEFKEKTASTLEVSLQF